jgi:asparagine synthase (glutamine-hydrolysing)
MTAILAYFGTGGRIPDDHEVREALTYGARGSRNPLQVYAEPGVIIGVSTSSTEPSQVTAGLALSVDDNYVVVADATLYYLPELFRKLGQAIPPTASPSQLVLAAFRAFGPACANHLEGDFAFLVWDRRERRVHCGRDFTGRRPLFLAEWGGGLIVSTSLDSIASLPGFNPRVNDTVVGADAAGLLFSLDDETCMRGVRTLRAGYAAEWSSGHVLRTQRLWSPGPMNTGTLGFDDAAEHLRDLLATAVRERLSATAPSAVWMSGGRDSTAVFAAGMYARRQDSTDPPLIPISRSHPIGDSGREDEAIDQIARFWQVEPHWVHSERIPMFPGFRNRGTWSAEPFAQPFEGLTRALAEAGRKLGSPVALDGYGGDFLFQVSRVYLADLVARGKVRRAMRDWRAMDRAGEGLRGFFSYGVQPNLPRWATRALATARGGHPLRDSMERIPPPWITPRFIAEHALRDRFAALGPASQVGTSTAERETRFYLSHQFFARVNSKMAGFALDHGVELRSPLLDRRIVQFALSRPREELNSAGDIKRLLRASMRGLLPEPVLAPRRAKTGTLTSYFAQHMRTDGLASLSEILPARALADAGIIEPDTLTREVARYREQGAGYPHVESLFCTLQAEIWLRARGNDAMPVGSSRQTVICA